MSVDIQPITWITVRKHGKIMNFVTESCLPEAYCHYKCPMGSGIASVNLELPKLHQIH